MSAIPSRVVLDTSAYSQLRRGHAGIIDWVATADIVYMPVIVLGELEAGFRVGRRYNENAVALTEFLDEPFVESLSLTPDVGRKYGAIFAQLKRNGTPIPVHDIWIAATTMNAGAHLLSFDHHFEKVEGLAHTCLSHTDDSPT
jgi:predicted nucleic acid-binding protein